MNAKMKNRYEERMREIISILNEKSKEYEEGHPTISDREWDDYYFKLIDIEKEAGFSLEDSPTKSIIYNCVNKLEKKVHPHPMLSLQKSKDLKDIEEWAGEKNLVAMPKLDGLTLALTYINGFLVAAETRGDGFIGEDVFHNAIVLKSVPKTILTTDKVVVHGEVIISDDNFQEVNKNSEYKHPRNYAAGAIRLLDSGECSRKEIEFVAFDLVEPRKENFSESLSYLYDLGFNVVSWWDNAHPIQKHVDTIVNDNKWENGYPIDGIVYRYNYYEDYDAAGATAHHYNGGYAYKFYDQEYETRLKYFNWSMGTTGVLTPVAVFDPVVIDGTTVERASVHNISVLKEIFGDPYYGQKIKVIKANQIIPQVVSAQKMLYGEVIARGGVTLYWPEYCPVCGSTTEIVVSTGGTEVLCCTNPMCEGKFLTNIDHFCGKKGLDIKGLSKSTLGDLIAWGWITEYKDIYDLKKYRSTWIKKDGYGAKSVDNILAAIEESKKCPLWRLLSAINIPLVGESTAKILAEHFKTYEAFSEAVSTNYDFTKLDDIGDITSTSIKVYNYNAVDDLIEKLSIKEEEKVSDADKILKGMKITITGKLKQYKNRDLLKSDIEKFGGSVLQTVTKNTNILIANEKEETAKYKNAIKYNIPIMTEEEFIQQWLTK